MRRRSKYIMVLAAALALAGCDEQRDLYTAAGPLLYVEGDWVPSLNLADMSMNATANLYVAGGGKLSSRNFFALPNSVAIPVTRGEYDLLLFNGLMYSETNTHLDNIYFRGTDRLPTFEAVVNEGTANKRLVRADGEYIASNDMEILTSMRQTLEIAGEPGYFIKYKDGKNGYPSHSDYVESSVYMTPAPVSYECQVIVNLVNPRSAYIANGALRGFVGSVFMSPRMPSHMKVTHQMRLNDLKIDPGSDPETGSIRSPKFVTFGPPLDDPDGWKYEFEINITLIDGNTHEETIDITDEIAPVIDELRKNLGVTEPVVTGYTIIIEIDVELEKLEPVEGVIGMDDWEDYEIIKVPIAWK